MTPRIKPKATTRIDLESFVAADHFLRRIDRVFDPSFLRELIAPRHAVERGRPSIDRDVHFRMQLVAYFYGIAKDRRSARKFAITSHTAGSVDWRSSTTCRTTHC
ncbi:MAG TPA: hypothetical protein VGM76_12145 [Lacipirellulaceae bacterium]